MDKQSKKGQIIVFSLIILCVLLVCNKTFSQEIEKNKSRKETTKEVTIKEENEEKPKEILGRTHIVQSPFVIPHGRLIYGSILGIGLFDLVELSTDLFEDFNQRYNLSLKYALYQNSFFASSFNFVYSSFSIKKTDGTSLAETKNFSPGVSMSFALDRSLAAIVGVNYNISSIKVTYDDAKLSGLVRGTTSNFELAYGYQNKKKRLGNSITIGTSYDINYKQFGFGLSHNWGNFKLGVHYYPKAKEQPIMPIIVGGGSLDL